ncbi:unnamed protein product [Clonostachys byssicola]|uniref:Uncharacterized protein n=1 Tax=Clonostachys byssicola TaxID=160290 RepID=A0A9N9UDM4_9HYPO|nr:unnamed protein product [Clonostachys byssicola]
MASTTAITAVASLTTLLPFTYTAVMSCVKEIYLVDAPEETCFQGTKPTPCSYFHLGAPTYTAKCFPKEWSPDEGAFMSPAGCPRKHTVACASTGAKETIATCCPDDGSQGTYDCIRDLEYDFMATDRCTRKIAKTVEFIYTTTTLGEAKTKIVTTSGSDQVIYAYGAEVRWQSSDYPTGISTTSPENTEASSTPNSTGSGGEQTSDSKESAGSEESHPATSGLSTPAKAGIGAGVGVAGLCLLVGIALLWRRSHQQAKKSSPQEVEVSRPEDSADEAMKQKEIVHIASIDCSSAGSVPRESPPWTPHEVDAPQKVHEAEGYVPTRFQEADSRHILELESPAEDFRMYRYR